MTSFWRVWGNYEGKLRKESRNVGNSGKRTPEDFLLEGWSDWRKQINLELSRKQRSEKVQRAETKKKEYAERFLQNQLLMGWRGGWSRMEADSKHEIEKTEKKISRMKPIETFFKRGSVSKINSGGSESSSAELFSSNTEGQIYSPKRKLSSIAHMISVG